MREPAGAVTMTGPTADQWWDFGSKAALLLALPFAGAVVKAWRSWRRRRQIRALERKAVRYLLDAMRHSLFLLSANDNRLVSMDELVRQKLLIDQLRDDMWVADGHASEREQQAAVAEIMNVITRTQAIRARKEAISAGQPPMFKDGLDRGKGE